MLEWQSKYDSLVCFRFKNSIFGFLGFIGDSCSPLAVQCYLDLYMGEGGLFSWSVDSKLDDKPSFRLSPYFDTTHSLGCLTDVCLINDRAWLCVLYQYRRSFRRGRAWTLTILILLYWAIRMGGYYLSIIFTALCLHFHCTGILTKIISLYKIWQWILFL